VIVQISAEAEADLEAIGDYIALDNPIRAVSFIGELRASCLSLSSMARAFPLVPGYESSGVRRRVHGNYLIFYTEGSERIVVLHVLQGAVDCGPILFPT
jgi:plasmid stabilization system protein ParE